VIDRKRKEEGGEERKALSSMSERRNYGVRGKKVNMKKWQLDPKKRRKDEKVQRKKKNPLTAQKEEADDCRAGPKRKTHHLGGEEGGVSSMGWTKGQLGRKGTKTEPLCCEMSPEKMRGRKQRNRGHAFYWQTEKGGEKKRRNTFITTQDPSPKGNEGGGRSQ